MQPISEGLREIEAVTLGHYTRYAHAFWGGTKDHRIQIRHFRAIEGGRQFGNAGDCSYDHIDVYPAQIPPIAMITIFRESLSGKPHPFLSTVPPNKKGPLIFPILLQKGPQRLVKITRKRNAQMRTQAGIAYATCCAVSWLEYCCR